MKKLPTSEETKQVFKDTLSKLQTKYENTPYYIDKYEFNTMTNFMMLLKLPEGEFAGENIPYAPYQAEYATEMICVRRKSDNYRKHSSGMLFVARKAGKSTFMGVLLLYYLFIDKAKGKQIYCVSNETQQAMLVFNAARNILVQNTTLTNKCNIWKSTKMIEFNKDNFNNFVKVLSGNADTADGKSSDLILFDELHQAKSPDMFHAMTESMAAKPNAQMMIISTAGYNHQGIMRQKYDYAKKVKEGVIKDDSFYSMIFELDEGDDWKDEKNWYKSNPTLGLQYGVSLEFLRSQFIKAQHSGVDEVSFKTKHLNIWTNSAITWIKNEDWNASFKYEINEEDLIGRECYAGLDLASTTDIAAFVLLFQKEEGEYDVLCRFFIPEEGMRERSRKDKVPYETWVKQGYITATDGNVIDYDFIEHQIKQDCEKFNVKEIAYDRWGATQLVTNLENEGISQMVQFGQGFASMSAPTKHIETLVLQQKLNHGNNPVLTWMMSNVALKVDPTNAIKIDKAKSSEKVDGMVALAMSIGIKIISKAETKAIPNIRSF